jgi:hypothetical protein
LGKGFTESFESGRRYRVRSPKGRWRRREVLNGEERREREEEEMAATEPLCREGCQPRWHPTMLQGVNVVGALLSTVAHPQHTWIHKGTTVPNAMLHT